MTYDLMSCNGFGKTVDAVTGVITHTRACNSGWIFSWIVIGILAILVMISKKWLGEEEIIGLPYNWITGALGILVCYVIIFFTGSYKFGFIGGIIGMLGLGILGGYIWQGGSGGI